MPWTADQMCRQAANELRDGMYVNLGIGMPTHVAGHIPNGMNVTLQSENGMLGLGDYPHEGDEGAVLINAGKETVTARTGASFFDSAQSFAMIRGGHIDISILGALEVSAGGDLANWMVPGKMVKGMGGAMDLVAGVKRTVILMAHTTKDGKPKILNECSLPLTGKQVIDRIITELGIFDITPNGVMAIELAPDVTLSDVAAVTEPELLRDAA